MLKFEDTKLMKHPTVERAYKVMRTFFEDGDDWAQQAIRAGEIISANAKTPDPDAIAASILMNGMIVPLDAEQFETSVSPKAAEYLKKFYGLDLDNPKFKSAGEEQVLLAQSMVGLEDINAKIAAGEVAHVIEFRNVQQVLDANERALSAIARKSKEPDMLKAAQTQLVAAQQALADIATDSAKQLEFENTGLPDHPLIRSVYEEMKAFALDGDPLGGYAKTNLQIARIVIETGASTDPEVISAALLNQYTTLKPENKAPAAMSPRIGELYEESSPWARLGTKDFEKNVPQTVEALMITNAARLSFLESNLRHFAAPGAKLTDIALEDLEDLRDKVQGGADRETHAGLQKRMYQAAAEADKILHQPDNVKIRKPGSPKIDRGW